MDGNLLGRKKRIYLGKQLIRFNAEKDDYCFAYSFPRSLRSYGGVFLFSGFAQSFQPHGSRGGGKKIFREVIALLPVYAPRQECFSLFFFPLHLCPLFHSFLFIHFPHYLPRCAKMPIQQSYVSADSLCSFIEF